ncbi:hypothetical protein [Streptomyces sp. NBC_01481]|uniref:hypothetical protein n=1 Tax=Streptomyces sp. NBC_01481 TaxID=2975869 RepID=UPI00225360CF|nr:hypothetical protein [Streptomyces sp. NBC_01481]MCX4582305.1 hypothetical protein [Streptomyces sp. NBC_01481]
MSRGEGVRRLSDTEAAFAYAHALLRGSGRLTTTFTVNGVLAPERVERAVELWVRRLPLLSLRIEDAGGAGLWFRKGAPGAFPVHEQEADGERLWRLSVGQTPVGTTRFSLTLHPAICDGYSVGRLVRPLLDALFGTPGACPGEQELPPDLDGLTYEGGGACGCAVCMPSGSPRRGKRAVTPYAGDSDGQAEEVGRAGDVVTLALSAYATRRLRSWCGTRQLTVSGFLTTVLADALARESGCTEVAVATAVSLRRSYAERALITEPGCVLGVVRAALRASPGGDPVGGARANAAALCAAGRAWRPERRAHAAVRRAVERAAAGEGGVELRVTDAGSVDTALGPHAGRVTGFRTVAAHGGTRLGGTLQLSSFKGALTVALAVGGPWVAVAERELTEAALLRSALLPV